MHVFLKKMSRTLRKSQIGAALVRAAKDRVITDYSEYLATPNGQRALVSYLAWPLLPPPRFRERVEFSNRGLAQEIPRALNELGYRVDVVNFDNVTWSPSRSYDLLIGHGGANFVRLAERVGSAATKLYFSTGLYWREWNLREAERLLSLTRRTGHLLPPDRPIKDDEEAANRIANGILCLGNANAARSYSGFPAVERVNNAAFRVDPEPRLNHTDFEAARRRFLFFSGPGNIHKGLDRLLEAFDGSPLELHVCQTIDERFGSIYCRQLTSLPNVHSHGMISMRSEAFRKMTTLCGWVIHPTAAEGQPGSVIECMAHGLVPILSSGANIDVQDFGILLPDCEVDTIRNVCAAASLETAEALRNRTAQVLEHVDSHYVPEAFRSAFRAAVSQLITVSGSAASRFV